MPTQSPESLPALAGEGGAQLAGEGGAREGGAQLAGAARGVLLPLPMWVSLRAHNTRRASVHASACAFTQAPEIQATRYTIWAIQIIQRPDQYKALACVCDQSVHSSFVQDSHRARCIFTATSPNVKKPLVQSLTSCANVWTVQVVQLRIDGSSGGGETRCTKPPSVPKETQLLAPLELRSAGWQGTGLDAGVSHLHMTGFRFRWVSVKFTTRRFYSACGPADLNLTLNGPVNPPVFYNFPATTLVFAQSNTPCYFFNAN